MAPHSDTTATHDMALLKMKAKSLRRDMGVLRLRLKTILKSYGQSTDSTRNTSESQHESGIHTDQQSCENLFQRRCIFIEPYHRIVEGDCDKLDLSSCEDPCQSKVFDDGNGYQCVCGGYETHFRTQSSVTDCFRSRDKCFVNDCDRLSSSIMDCTFQHSDVFAESPSFDVHRVYGYKNEDRTDTRTGHTCCCDAMCRLHSTPRCTRRDPSYDLQQRKTQQKSSQHYAMIGKVLCFVEDTAL